MVAHTIAMPTLSSNIGPAKTGVAGPLASTLLCADASSIYVRQILANELHLKHPLHSWILFCRPSGGSYTPDTP